MSGVKHSPELTDAYLKGLAAGRTERRGWEDELNAAWAEARRELGEFRDGLTGALNAHGVPAMPSWREAIDWLAAHGGGER